MKKCKHALCFYNHTNKGNITTLWSGKQRQARTSTGRADPAGLEQAHGLPYHKNCNLRHNYTNQ